jgi:hypothetical protein
MAARSAPVPPNRSLPRPRRSSSSMAINLKSELDKLASTLVADATAKDAQLSDKVAAFKELRAYYALTLKQSLDDPDDGEGFTFENGLGNRHDATAKLQRRGNS